MRGKAIRKYWELGTPGSPPPMRGKGVKAIAVMDDARITPAYAGKRATYNVQKEAD